MKKARGIKGFTLVEMVLTVVIIGIIAGVSAKILLSGIQTYDFVVNRKDATHNARVAMDRIVDELILIKSADISSIANGEIDYIDQDGVTSSFKCVIEDGRSVLNRGEDFLAGVCGLLDFDFLKANDSTTGVPLEVKKINIELWIDALRGYGSITLRTEVFPRNLMYTNFKTL